MSNIQSLIESKRSPENIISIQEAKIKGTTFSPELEKKITSAGFRIMKNSDFLGYGGAPRGSYIKDKGDITMLVSPYSDGPHVEAYIIDMEDQQETAQWSRNSGLKAVGNLKKIWNDLVKTQLAEEFRAAAKKNGASQVGF